MGSKNEPYITTSQNLAANSRYLNADQLNNIQENLSSAKHAPPVSPSPEQAYETPVVIELDRVDSVTYGGAPFVFKGALKKPNVEIQRQQSRMGKIHDSVSTTVRTYSSILKNVVLFLLLALYTAYFVWALVYSIDGATALIILTSLSVFGIIYSYISNNYGEAIYTNVFKPCGDCMEKNWPWARWILLPAGLVGVIFYVAFYVITEIQQLQSISGNVIFIVGLYITSKHPSRIKWRPVVWGFTMQFVIGILVLRWKPGYDAVKWFSDELMKFIYYSLEGASVVFGDPMLFLHPYVFVSMPMLIYIGAVMGIMYYWGITQVIASKLGWLVQVSMGTTAIESLSVAGNIFLNGMDVMLMLKSYVPRLTKSEFFCFLVGNHSTVAGFAFPLFVMYGAPPEYLLSAAVMSAPAAIAVSKINYPETEESVTKRQEDIKLEKGNETNVTEAAANGSAVAGKTVMAVVVNYIAFLGLLGFINATLSWFGGRVGYPELSFDLICSYIFYPLSIIMGVEPADAREVARLVGLKVFATELLAFQELGYSIRSGLISARSASITTYALSGFSSLSTLAIAVGVWNTVIPSKTHEMTSNMIRAVICANISCFMTACVAALLFDPSLVPPADNNPINKLLAIVFDILPTYQDIMNILPGYNY